MKKVIYFMILILCYLTITVQAQENKENDFPKQKKYTFTFQPLHVFNNSFRVDFEMRLKNGPGWLQFGANYYRRNIDENIDYPSHYYYLENDDYLFYYYRFTFIREPYSNLIGGGLDINYKRYFEPKRTLYIATGLSYNYFNFKYIERNWIVFKEEDLQFEKMDYCFDNQQINRLGINCLIGFQPQVYKPFVIDFFWGFSLRYSISDENKPLFDQTMFSYGYSGLALLTGFKIGFGIR